MSSPLEEIHITRWGTEGPEVVLIHGGPRGGPGGGDQYWFKQKQLADRGWQLIVPDRPGHGKSPAIGREDMEADGIWAAELLGDGMHLVGHSYGGLTALAAAGLRPDAVKSLTLVEAPVFSAAPDDPRVQQFDADLEEEITKDRTPIETLAGFGKLVRIPIGELPGPPPTMEQLAALGAGVTALHQPNHWDSSAQLESVANAKIPVLVVTGGGSPGFEGIGDGLTKKLNGEHLMIDLPHHFPHWSDDFNDALDKFLRSAETQSGS